MAVGRGANCARPTLTRGGFSATWGVSASRRQGCPLAKNLVRYSFVLAIGGELGDVVANVFKRLSRVLFPIFSEYICVAPVLLCVASCVKAPRSQDLAKNTPRGRGPAFAGSRDPLWKKKIYIYIYIV